MNTTGIGEWSAQKCPHCDCYHNGACPEVRAIEYYPNGKVKRVEFERGQGKPAYQLGGGYPCLDKPRQWWETYPITVTETGRCDVSSGECFITGLSAVN